MNTKKRTLPGAGNHRVTIRFNDEQFELLSSYAEKAGMSLAGYMRELLLKKTPSVSYELVFNDPLILKIFSNLSNVTGNLNQIAHHLNSNKGWSKDLRERVLSNLSDIQDMRKELKEHLGGFRGDC